MDELWKTELGGKDTLLTDLDILQTRKLQVRVSVCAVLYFEKMLL